MGDQFIIPSPTGDDFVELARDRRAQGRVFRKHILNLGTLVHPKTGQRLNLDEAWFDRVQHNFNTGVCDIVQVPVADAANRHVETPLANIGEVIDIKREGKKVYAIIDARKHADDLGKTMLGASAFLNMDYTDTRTGKRAGPTLLHVAVTNRPYVTGLDDYEELIAATAMEDPSDSTGDVVILSGPEASAMTKEELLEALKSEHGIDVADLEARAARSSSLDDLTSALTQSLQGAPTLQLSGAGGGELALSDIVGAVAELADHNQALAADVIGLKRKGAEDEIDGYISSGRVLPKQRAAFVNLALTNREMLDALLPEEPVVALNNQSGVPGRPQGEQRQETDIDQEILRLTTQDTTKNFFAGR